MFDLETAIAQWRQQMLSAGIKTPVPLEELEGHLREEIERQIQSGASEQEAFQRTVLQIGQAKDLKAEFAKDRNLLSFLGVDKFTKIVRIVGTLWLAYSCWGFVMTAIFRLTYPHAATFHLMGLLLWATYGAGIFGSILAIRGTRLGRWIVGISAGVLALFTFFILFRLIPTLHPRSGWVCALAAFYAITASLMFLPSYPNIKPARE